RNSNNTYWDGNSFSSPTESFRAATNTTSWSYPFPISNFPANGSYTIHAKSTDNAGNPEASPTVTFSVSGIPSATITTPAEGYFSVSGLAVSLSASFSDTETADIHTCTINWDYGRSN